MKILIFKFGMLGDIIMTTPFLRQLRGRYKNAQIDFLVGKNSSIVLKNNNNLDNVIEFDEQIFTRKQIMKLFFLIKEIRRNKYDKVFILDKHWVSHFITVWFFANERIGFKRKKVCFFLHKSVFYGKIRNEIYYYLDLLVADSGKAEYKDVKTELFFDYKKQERSLLKSKIAIINSGGKNVSEQSNCRMMPDDLFLNLLKKLSKDMEIILLGGESDRKYYEKFGLENKNIVIKAGVSFKESLCYMYDAKCVITTDCGAMHMAGAIGVDTICVFGPTHPKRKMPIGRKNRYVWKDDDMYNSEYEIYRKIPKGRYMEKISADDIIGLI